MVPDFLIAYKITKGHEGVYSNDPTDKGAETCYGISRVYNPNWIGWVTVDRMKGIYSGQSLIDALSKSEDLRNSAAIFYKRQYWDVNKLDNFNNQLICNEMFDTGVNMGVGVAAKFIQTALNVSNNRAKLYPDIAVDGIIGSVTIGLVNKHPRPDVLLKLLNVQQGNYYIQKCLIDKEQEKFLNGWYNRVFEVSMK